jgi:hypothetical protein
MVVLSFRDRAGGAVTRIVGRALPHARERVPESADDMPRVRGVRIHRRLGRVPGPILLVFCAAALVPASAHARSRVPTPRLFASTSVWNHGVRTTAVDPSSKRRMKAFDAEIGREVSSGTGPWIGETAGSTPFYVVPAGQRKVFVKLDTGSWGAELQAALAQGVPIPPDAVPAAGPDGHMTIYQPATDTLWEFWKAVRKPDGWHASWGGVMRHVSSNPGYYTGSSWPGLTGPSGWNWGSTATSLPVIAGTIRIAELRAGAIPHALALDIPEACAHVFSWPAQRTDGTSTAPDCLPEGARLRLDPTLDLAKLDLPPVTRILARAAQRYGIIVRDVTHHAVGFYAEDPTPTGTNPYLGPKGLYDGLRPWSFLPQFPWAHLQLLKLTECTSAPCLPARRPARHARRKP